MAKTSRKVNKGVKIGLEVLDSIRQMKRGEATVVYRENPAKKAARRAA